MELDISIDNMRVPFQPHRNLQILGVTFDSLLKCNKHTRNIRYKIQAKNNVLKILAESTWGKDNETLAQTYKAISRPVFKAPPPLKIGQSS